MRLLDGYTAWHMAKPATEGQEPWDDIPGRTPRTNVGAKVYDIYTRFGTKWFDQTQWAEIFAKRLSPQSVSRTWRLLKESLRRFNVPHERDETFDPSVRGDLGFLFDLGYGSDEFAEIGEALGVTADSVERAFWNDVSGSKRIRLTERSWRWQWAVCGIPCIACETLFTPTDEEVSRAVHGRWTLQHLPLCPTHRRRPA